MENEIKDGGPAFPEWPTTLNGIKQLQGMTLRDYFAAKAMQSLVFELVRDNCSIFEKSVAKEAYALADAMLAAREGEA